MKIAISGARGKMGRLIAEQVQKSPGLELAAEIDLDDSIEAATRHADVVIDFSAPSACAPLAESAAANGCALVVGTTGLGAAELAALAKAATKIPVVQSANMSLGVNVMFGLLAQAARALGAAYDIEIVEWHHRQKKDAPSGTALAMAEVLARALGRDLEQSARYGREGQVGARTADEIGILAVRGGDVVGDHTASFLGLGDRLEITHRASSRETFARGAVRAAEWVHGKPPALYDMQDVLGLKSAPSAQPR